MREPESAARLSSSPFEQALEQNETVQNKGKGKNLGNSTGKGKARNEQPDRRRQQVSSVCSDDEEELPFLVCGDNFRNNQTKEVWIQCQQCLKLTHDKCTERLLYFLCPNCESDYSD